MNAIIRQVDHLVYAAPDLLAGIDEVESLLGIAAIMGGSHPQWGTANALLSLGDDVYLEVIGPDPEQPEFSGERAFGIDGLSAPKLVTWAANTADIDSVCTIELAPGQTLGTAFPASREQTDGSMLHWRLTNPMLNLADGLVPFFIDWGRSPHPSQNTPRGASLLNLAFEHPDTAQTERMLQTLGFDVTVQTAERPALLAVIEGHNGEVELR